MISILLAALVACSKTETPAEVAPEDTPVVVEAAKPAETPAATETVTVPATEATPAPATTPAVTAGN